MNTHAGKSLAPSDEKLDVIERPMTIEHVPFQGQFAGVMRVMNTSSNGFGVQGLECGTCWLSYDLTEKFEQLNCSSQYVIAVTNHHVVGGSSTVNCNYYFNNNPVMAHVIVTDHKNDVALLALDVNALQSRAGDKFRVEDILMRVSDVEFQPGTTMKCQCVGYPFGRSGITVTSGVLGAYTVIDQKLNIVTSTSANPGNSGGCAVHRGAVVGITTAVSKMGLNNETYITPVQYALALAPMMEMPHVMAHVKNVHVMFFDDHVKSSGCLGFKECGTPLTTQEWLDKHGGVGDHVLYERLAAHTCGSEIDVTPCGDCVSGNPSHDCPHPFSIRPRPVQWNPICNWCPSGLFYETNHKQMEAKKPSPYPAATKPGVFVTKVFDHEPALKTGDYIMGIEPPGKDIIEIDSFGLMPNGRPFHTEMQFNPMQVVKLIVARKGIEKALEVEYTYNTVCLDKLPTVHSATLGPNVSPILVGGVMMQVLTTEMATRFGYHDYLEDKADELALVVVNVMPNSPEWTVLQLTPGSLCTKVNHVKFSDQSSSVGDTVLDKIKTMFNNFNKDGYITLTFETRNMKTGKMKEVCHTTFV